MKVALLTREYPPEVYGGAGVHVEYLSRELARLADVEVRCFGGERSSPPGGPLVRAFRGWDALAGDEPYRAALDVMSTDLSMVVGLEDASLVHSHTWYANLAGHLAKLIHGIPHVMTTHSLEPLRPWKQEQLGDGGYALSSFCEGTAIREADRVVAVSAAMGNDILRAYPEVDPSRVEVIHNGIDAEEYRPDPATGVLENHGIDPSQPYVLFVGRVTRQKGIVHLLRAAHRFDPGAQIVLAAGAPDTPEIAREMSLEVESLDAERGGVLWIRAMLERREVIQLLTHATVFVCPSIYEPLGIVNLEAMACETAVVATATGGIPEVVEDGVTGLLVPFEPGDVTTREPTDPHGFAQAIADKVNELLADPFRAKQMGHAGRQRVLDRFTWHAIAARTHDLYERLLASQ